MEETPVYSISRLDCINNCLTEAYYTYRENDRGEKNVYTICGSLVHQCLEDIVNGRADEKDLLPAMERELSEIEDLGITFPKDARGGDAVKNGWVSNMTHFCKNYKSPKKIGMQTEVEVHYTTPSGNHLVGYIDLLWVKKDGTAEIFDYKTSSMFTKDELQKKGRQLILYCLAEEAAGITITNVSWIMLKYVDIQYIGYKTKKSKEKTALKKTVERRKIVSELQDSIRIELAEQGINELEIDFIMEDALRTNEIPDQVSNIYKVTPAIIEYQITDEIKQECIEYIDSTIAKWNALSNEDCYKQHRNFTRIQKNGKEVNDYYYCSCLCPHNKKCPHFRDFLNTMVKNEEEDLLS